MVPILTLQPIGLKCYQIMMIRMDIMKLQEHRLQHPELQEFFRSFFKNFAMISTMVVQVLQLNEGVISLMERQMMESPSRFETQRFVMH